MLLLYFNCHKTFCTFQIQSSDRFTKKCESTYKPQPTISSYPNEKKKEKRKRKSRSVITNNIHVVGCRRCRTTTIDRPTNRGGSADVITVKNLFFSLGVEYNVHTMVIRKSEHALLGWDAGATASQWRNVSDENHNRRAKLELGLG